MDWSNKELARKKSRELQTIGIRASTVLRTETEEPRKSPLLSSPWAEIQILLGEHSLDSLDGREVALVELAGNLPSRLLGKAVPKQMTYQRHIATKQSKVEGAGGKCWVLLAAGCAQQEPGTGETNFAAAAGPWGNCWSVCQKSQELEKLHLKGCSNLPC